MSWHNKVIDKLTKAKIFSRVELVGVKIRATLDEDRFLDIYFDPTTGSYSYALIDLTLPYPGDKRAFGWDDYPHEHTPEIKKLRSHPHHFQRRSSESVWIFEESPMRGDVEKEISIVIQAVRHYLKKRKR
ncbi:hypothetical protein HYR54_17825 [Candidatus Acetothermia bacterium]|nr:hypothetical protein [Candidatus Acetothermia bacterium]